MLNYFHQTYGAFVTNDFSVGDGLNYSGYRFRAPVKLDNNAFVMKLDYHIDAAAKHTLFWRGSLQNINNPQEPFLPGLPPETTLSDHSKGLALGYTAVLSTTKVNSFRWGFTRQSDGWTGNTNHDTNLFLGLDQGHTYAHNFQIPLHNLTDDFSWTRGTHSLQFGTNIGIARDARLTYGHSYNFGLGTSNWMSPTGIADTASPMDPTNFTTAGGQKGPEVDLGFKAGYDRPMIALLGLISDDVSQYNYNKDGTVQNYTLDQFGNPLSATNRPMKRNYGLNWYEFYAQDSWRMRRNFTLTYGLRWSLFPAPWETNGFQGASKFGLGTQFNINARNMKQGLGYTSEDPITLIPGGKANNGPAFYPLSKTNFAPRIAFAYSPQASGGIWKKIFGEGEKTSIRGGFASAYDRAGFQLINTFDTNAPGGFSYTLQNLCCTPGATDVTNAPRVTDLNTVPNKIIQFSPTFTYQFLQPALPGTFPQQLPLTATNLWALDNTLTAPRSYAVDFSIARELPNRFSLQVAYVGRFGRHLLTRRDLNQPLDIVDKTSGIDYFKAGTALSKLGRANQTAIASGAQTYTQTLASVSDTSPELGNTAAYWHDVLPGLSGGATAYVSGCGGTVNGSPNLTLIQAVYDNYYNPGCAYVGNEIVGLYDIDQFGLLGDNGSHPPVFASPNPNPLFFNGPTSPLTGQAGKYLNYQAISAYAWSSIGNSTYHALQASLRKQFSNGVQFDLNYTYSKSIDITSSAARVGFSTVGYENVGTVGSLLENAFNPKSQRAVSDFDTTHQLNANWLAELPFGRGKRFGGNAGTAADALIGGWQITGVGRWTSGYPFTVDVGQNWPTDWFYTGITQMIAKPKTGVYKHPNGSVTIFPDPTAAQNDFIIPYPGGGLSRNALRGQGYAGIDMGLSKRWRFLENQSVQFKWDVFNVLNQVRFNAQGLGNAVTSLNQAPTLFGTYSSLLTQPRVMQFALRYEF
jgi:hypothetical protein